MLAAAAHVVQEAKKRKIKAPTIGPDGKIVPQMPPKPRKKIDRFDGLPEDEIAKRILPDHLGPNLDIVIVSLEPCFFLLAVLLTCERGLLNIGIIFGNITLF